MAISVTFACFEGGGLGWFLTFMALGWGSSMWVGTAYTAVRDGELYFAAGSATVVPTFLLQYMAAALYRPHAPAPYGPIDGMTSILCRADYPHFLPDLSVALLYAYWILCETQESHLGIKVSLFGRLKRLFYLICVPAIVVWSRNASLLNAVYGALLGAGVGACMSALLTVVISPRLPDLVPITQFFNMAHDTALLEALYDSQHSPKTRLVSPSFM